MLRDASRPRRLLGTVLGGLVLVAAVAGLGGAAAAKPSGGSVPNGITVSWLPTDQPAKIVPGHTSRSKFWVTNDSAKPIPVKLTPATAQPGNDGSLQVRKGADPRFPSITLTPSRFVAKPHSIRVIHVRIVSPPDLSPGAYLLPAIVQPRSTDHHGNIKIERSIVALTTFQVPGPLAIHMQAELLPPAAPKGSLLRKLPGLPLVEIGTTTASTLRITSHSGPGIYAYYEVSGSHALLGSIDFDGHTSGLPTDVRGASSLYFSGLYRDFPLRWHSGVMGLGKVDVVASVSFNPEPSQVQSVQTSLSMVVVSPWWFAVIAVLFGLLLSVSARRTRKLAHEPRARRRSDRPAWSSRVGVPVAIGVLTAISAVVATYWLATAVAVIGAVAAVVVVRRVRRAAGTGPLLVLHLGAAGVVALGVALLVVAEIVSWSPGPAVAVIAGAGIWTLSAWLLYGWIATRGVRPAAVPTAEPATT